ncbi:MAG: hypothetical protein ACPGUD_05075 [Parashewanella sp.]
MSKQTVKTEKVLPRFDLTILNRLTNTTSIRRTYDDIRKYWKNDPVLKKLCLTRQVQSLTLPKNSDEEAAISCLDYHFERFYLPTMSTTQADAYINSIRSVLKFPEVIKLSTKGSAIIESVHHQSIFSIFYCLVAMCGEQHGFQHAIMMYQQSEPDPRLIFIQHLLKKLYGIEVTLIQFDESSHWYKQLKQSVINKSIIVYLGDMSPNIFNGKASNSAHHKLQLVTSKNENIELSRLSVAEKISQKLGVEHLVANIDINNKLTIETAEDAKFTLTCPLNSWVFWPAIGSVYEK